MVKYVALIYTNFLNLILNCILTFGVFFMTFGAEIKNGNFCMAVLGHHGSLLPAHLAGQESGESGFLNLYQFMPYFLIKIQGSKFR